MASFKYTEEYQDLFLSCLVTRSAEFDFLTNELKAEYLTGVQATLAAKCLLDYRKAYSRYPSWAVLRELAAREVAKLGDRDVEAAHTYIDKIRQLPTEDWEHVRDNIASFLRERACIVALQKCVKLLQEDKVPDGGIAPLLEEAWRVGENLNDLGVVFHADIDTVVAKVTQVDYGIFTGYPMLDRIWRNGWGPGWLIALLAPPKRFKTTVSLNLACNMVSPAIGGDVIYYACEIDQELAMVRAMCRIAGIKQDYMYENPGKFSQDVKDAMRSSVAGNLLFKSFPAKSAKISDIRAHAKTAVKQLGLKPKAIYIDYAETVAPDDVAKNDPEYRRSAAVYTGARALGQELGCCVVMPDRCNRETTDAPVPNMTSFQGAFEKAGIVDVAIGLCSTEEEYRQNLLREFVFLNRHGPAFQHFRGPVDPTSYRVEINEEIEFEPEEPKPSRGSRRRSTVPAELQEP